MNNPQLFNLKFDLPLEAIYSQGYLPQRNQKDLYYLSTSCRSNLSSFSLSSENRRILNKTSSYIFQKLKLSDFTFNPTTKKQISLWIKTLGWDFPISSVKTIFTEHLFNQLYIWQEGDTVIGYAICLDTPTFSHIAYVFYQPEYSRTNLPIRMVLQFIIDSQLDGKKYCYLGQFSKDTGYYKRTMPGFEYFFNGSWQKNL
jgi:arginyl-tRNA--protein-N-Asp/Glu arginylyltransferase